MKEYGNIYVPDECLTEQCHVHFAFHGRGGSDMSVRHKAYNNFAARNKMVVIYPRSGLIWNHDGRADEGGDHMTKDGMYPRIMMAMLDRLTECD
jgi:poly(3-hydroxybutyrate) depolymerase